MIRLRPPSLPVPTTFLPKVCGCWPHPLLLSMHAIPQIRTNYVAIALKTMAHCVTWRDLSNPCSADHGLRSDNVKLCSFFCLLLSGEDTCRYFCLSLESEGGGRITRGSTFHSCFTKKKKKEKCWLKKRMIGIEVMQTRPTAEELERIETSNRLRRELLPVQLIERVGLWT